MKNKKDCNCPEENIEESNFSSIESTPNENLSYETSFSGEDIPSELPPSEEGDNQEEGFGAGTWHQNKKVTRLWSKDETRNSWAAFSSLGWKRLNSSNNSSCVALTILASHAKQYNKNVKIKIDNNQVKEMYVW